MARGRKTGLGKGLDSLIPPMLVQETAPEGSGAPERKETAAAPAETEQGKNGQMMEINRIEPNRAQPRRQFDRAALEELAASIANYGVLQPILVQKDGGHYTIIAGERRWRAAKLAGCREVPVIIREYSDRERKEIALIENIQRENLNPIEEAAAYQSLVEDYHLKHEEIAERVSKSRSAITNAMRLLKLDANVQQMLADGRISMGHARALLALEDHEAQSRIAAQVEERSLSVRETERLVRNALAPVKEKPAPEKENPAVEAAYRSSEEQLKQILGTKVEIQRKDENRGKIEISYFSLDELERIIDLLEACGR